MRYFLAKRAGGPGAVRRRSHRHAASRARRPRGWPASSIRATRGWCRRTTSSSSRWSAAPIPIRPTRASSRPSAARCRPTSTRSAGATSAPRRSRVAEVAAARRARRRPARRSASCFSGGIDSGAVFLVTYHAMLRLGLSPARLKAFVLDSASGPDVEQARAFLDAVGLRAVPRGDRRRPGGSRPRARRCACSRTTSRSTSSARRWACCSAAASASATRTGGYLADGDGGDENLKDYPIEENPELTIRSVVDNLMLYQEGWGVGRIKHSLTYSGGLSRSYVRTYAPARRYGFDGFSPFTRPASSRSPRAFRSPTLTGYDVPTLYALKGEIVAARRQGGHRPRHAGLPEAAVPARRRRRPTRCAPRSARRRARRAYRRGFLGAVRADVQRAAAYPAGRAARDRFVLVARGRRAPAHDPWRHQGVARRASRTADGARRRRRHRVPHRPRVPVALRDVRPVAAHDRRPTRRPARSRADRPARSAEPARAASRDAPIGTQAVQRRQLLRSARGAAGATTTRSPRRSPAFARVIVESHPRAGRRSHVAASRRTRAWRRAPRSRSRWGSRPRTRTRSSG